VSPYLRVENATRKTVLAERGELADNPWRRLKGLLGRSALAAPHGLIIRPCQGVHTWFMTFPIDVVHVDAHGVVRRIIAEMPPNRIGPLVWKAAYVVELPAGSARASGTEVGDVIELSAQ
jgi:uncharacterized membrane protein (UPF0127 family)